MKNTFKIFFSDIKSLSRHFFAVLVVIAIMIILYAWVNIYANSDPYGNTGNISVAVASDDLGYEGQNMGESVLEGLKDNKSINWVFTGSTDKAIKGVESGKYYAAIVIGENFSRNMYDLKSALTDNESTVTYYKNAKTNAIAVKITDTAAETVQNNVKVQYLKVLFQTVFTKDDLIQEIPVLLSKETNAVLVHTAEDVNILLPNDVTTDMLERKVTVYGDTAFAPIEAGQELGEMTLSYDGYDYATVKLLAADSVSVNRFLQGKYLLSQFFSKPLVKILTVVVILLVLAVVVWVRMLRPKSRYGSRGRRNRGTRNYRGRRR